MTVDPFNTPGLDPHVPLVDVHEPNLMKSLLTPLGFQESALNEQGWADYRWVTHDGTFHHVERKTWGELGDLDGVEAQLYRHLTNHKKCGAKLTWVLEGVCTPTQFGYMVYKEARSKGNMLFVPAHQQHRPMKLLHSWLYRIGKFVEIQQTADVPATANLLSAMYLNDQKAEDDHQTLHRYYKAVTFHPNPQVAKLMSIADGIGPIRAEAIIKRFGTLWNVLTAQPDQLAGVPGIGLDTARKLLQRVGRPDV